MTYKEKKIILGVASLSTEVHVSWLVKELEKAWAALEFYSNENTAVLYNNNGTMNLDQGERAREALNG